ARRRRDLPSVQLVFFFFQAEDGIRDFHVTGVQACALPIYQMGGATSLRAVRSRIGPSTTTAATRRTLRRRATRSPSIAPPTSVEIGRASCRERGGVWGVGGAGDRRDEGRMRECRGRVQRAE